MVFSFSLSTSASVVASASVNGSARGWGYRRESYSNNLGSGVRTTRQNLGQAAPTVQTTMYDAQGRPFLTDAASGNAIGNGGGGGVGGGRVQQRPRTVRSRIISIEDVTEEEERKAEERKAAREQRRAAREQRKAAREAARREDGEETN